MLTVGVPTLTQEDVTGLEFAAEKPIKLECASVTFPDGSPLLPEGITSAGYLIHRNNGGGVIDVWDDQMKRWMPAVNQPEPQGLFFQDDKWRGLIVAIGEKDTATNQDKFATDRTTGYPKYFASCLFKGKDGESLEHEGVSPNSSMVEIMAFGEMNRAGLLLEPKNNPISGKEEIRMFLKDSGLHSEKGRVSIREEGGGFRLEMFASGARIDLMPDGSIILTPGVGQEIRVEGNLSVNGTVSATNLP